MRIEITDLDIKELLHVLKNFPDGKITAEKDRAYWDANFAKKQLPQRPPKESLPEQIQKQAEPNAVGKMQDYLFDTFAIK